MPCGPAGRLPGAGIPVEVKVFETQDGALVVAAADATLSDELLRVGALHYLGNGCVCATHLSDELLTLVSRGAPALAQPADVQVVLRAICQRP